MVVNNLKPHTIGRTKPMLKTFRSAHYPYKIYLEEKKKKTYLKDHKKQTLHISDDIDKLKLQVKQKVKAVKMIRDEFVECVRLLKEKN